MLSDLTVADCVFGSVATAASVAADKADPEILGVQTLLTLHATVYRFFPSAHRAFVRETWPFLIFFCSVSVLAADLWDLLESSDCSVEFVEAKWTAWQPVKMSLRMFLSKVCKELQLLINYGGLA